MRYPPKCGFATSRPPCSLEDLELFEKSLPQKRLPSHYRDFLLEWNGGDFSLDNSEKEALFADYAIGVSLVDPVFPDTLYPAFVDELHGLFNANSIDDLRRGGEAYGFGNAVPPTYLAIGGSSYDTGRICISTDGNDFGAIYHWGGEPWDVPSELSNEFLSFIAPDFATFWSLLSILNIETAEKYEGPESE